MYDPQIHGTFQVDVTTSSSYHVFLGVILPRNRGQFIPNLICMSRLVLNYASRQPDNRLLPKLTAIAERKDDRRKNVEKKVSSTTVRPLKLPMWLMLHAKLYCCQYMGHGISHILMRYDEGIYRISTKLLTEKTLKSVSLLLFTS